MNSNTICHKATLLLLSLTPLISAYCLSSPDGGSCNATDSIEIAQVTKVFHWVELQSETGERFDVDSEIFALAPQLGHIYQLKVRRHLSGGCQPLAVKAANKLSKPGVSLMPSDVQKYQGAFILDVARNCAHKPMGSCAGELKLSNDFDLQQQRTNLDTIKPKSLAPCTAMTIAAIWPEIIADGKQPRLIGCIQTIEGNAKAVEFLRADVDTEEGLLLNKFY